MSQDDFELLILTISTASTLVLLAQTAISHATLRQPLFALRWRLVCLR